VLADASSVRRQGKPPGRDQVPGLASCTGITGDVSGDCPIIGGAKPIVGDGWDGNKLNAGGDVFAVNPGSA
jgi:hypothetical protein